MTLQFRRPSRAGPEAHLFTSGAEGGAQSLLDQCTGPLCGQDSSCSDRVDSDSIQWHSDSPCCTYRSASTRFPCSALLAHRRENTRVGATLRPQQSRSQTLNWPRIGSGSAPCRLRVVSVSSPCRLRVGSCRSGSGGGRESASVVVRSEAQGHRPHTCGATPPEMTAIMSPARWQPSL